jgi:predicted amidohydrolase
MIQAPYLACAVQLTSTPDLEASLAQAQDLIERAVARGARLIGLPENFPQICETQEEAAAAVPATYPVAEAFLAEQARRHGVVVFGGVVAPGDAGKVRNLLVVADARGTIIARYAKRHLFDVVLGGADTLTESACVEPGQAPVTADLGDLGNMGLSICYDVRFPEHYRALVDQGAELLTVPAAFLNRTGQDHWHVLLRARAIENTCYLLAPAQAGRHNARRASYGHAVVIDPWGHVLADAGEGPGLAIAEIDPARLATVRAQLPCLAHRR